MFISSAPAFCYLKQSTTNLPLAIYLSKRWFFFSFSVLIWFLNKKESLSLQIIFLFGIKLWKTLSMVLLKRYNCLVKIFPSWYEMSLRCLNQISFETDISKTSQKHLKRNTSFLTSLRHLKYISKRMSFLWRL